MILMETHGGKTLNIVTKNVNPIPNRYHTLQPAINVAEVDAAIAFVKQAFGAVETDRYDMPDGSTTHVEVIIGNSILVLGPPDPVGEFPAKILIYVEEVDDVYRKALDAGARHGNATTEVKVDATIFLPCIGAFPSAIRRSYGEEQT